MSTEAMFHGEQPLHGKCQIIGRSRRSDPDTSRQAADQHGKRISEQAREALHWAKRYPGHTACELAELMATATGQDQTRLRFMFSRRLADLEHAGEVRKGREARACSVNHTRQSTWWPV